jgi:2-phospho-L-lactate guanylyltransferase
VSIWVVLPIKDPAAAKSRLGPRIPAPLRQAVAEQLARRTLALLAGMPDLPVVVVTTAHWVMETAAAAGCIVLPETGRSHSAAARQGAHFAQAHGVQFVLSLAADLPLLSSSDIHALIRRAVPHTAILAPDRLGLGTNAVLAPPTFPFSFGAPSLERHIALAQAADLTVQLLRTPGLGVDLDSAWDLDLVLPPH